MPEDLKIRPHEECIGNTKHIGQEALLIVRRKEL